MRVLALAALSSLVLSVSGDGSFPQYTGDGQLVLPEGYREWVFLSSGVGMTYGPVGAGRGFPAMFDNVFVKPEAYRAFRESGHWPDKTVFVLEVRYAESHGSINKDGHFQTDLSGLEALVRDEGRFEEKWGFFGFETRGGEPARAGRRIGREAGCLACHTANGAVDGTFVQFYPTLLEVAEKKGTLRADFKPFTPSPVRLYHTLDREGWPAAEKVLATARSADPGAAVVHLAVLNSLGYELLGAKKAALAVQVLQWAAAANPTSANAQDSLAEALEAAGEPARAREAARKALDLLAKDEALGDGQRKAIEEANRKRVERDPY
jgi:tetratricopeptide (TPR) repeat protein